MPTLLRTNRPNAIMVLKWFPLIVAKRCSTNTLHVLARCSEAEFLDSYRCEKASRGSPRTGREVNRPKLSPTFRVSFRIRYSIKSVRVIRTALLFQDSMMARRPGPVLAGYAFVVRSPVKTLFAVRSELIVPISPLFSKLLQDR